MALAFLFFSFHVGFVGWPLYSAAHLSIPIPLPPYNTQWPLTIHGPPGSPNTAQFMPKSPGQGKLYNSPLSGLFQGSWQIYVENIAESGMLKRNNHTEPPLGSTQVHIINLCNTLMEEAGGKSAHPVFQRGEGNRGSSGLWLNFVLNPSSRNHLHLSVYIPQGPSLSPW